MNDIEYLSQIAKDNRAPKAKTAGKFPIEPKWLKIIGIGILGVILIVILGGIISGISKGERDIIDRIYARTQNLNASISEYGDMVKSSELRSMGNSLSTVLLETGSKVAGLLTSEYGADGTDPQRPEITEEEAQHIAEVNADLNYGRLNGLLDRYFAREMTREIGLLKALESEATEKTKSDTVKDVMVNSWNNLNKLETQFTEYENSTN